MANLNLSPSGGALKYIIDLIYPVKSYFITENTDLNTPAKVKEHFHGIGEWEQLPEGTFVEATAGSPTNHDAGLPNITGKISNKPASNGDNFLSDNAVANMGIEPNSALFVSETQSTKYMDNGGGSANSPQSIDFDAHRCNAIYGSSTTVQPKSRTAYIYRRKS